MEKKIAKDLLQFLKESPSSFHAIHNIKTRLLKEGFEELIEGNTWNIVPGKKYFVTRNDSSIVAVKLGTQLENYSFNIVASHSDSPTFKLKENMELERKGKYVQLNTEGYGGMICSSWFDRPLSVAGRVIVKEENTFVSKLLNVDRDLLMIPSLAIHMNRSVNDGYTYNKQKDMLPIFKGGSLEKGEFKKFIAQELQVDENNIYGMDLYLYNRMEPSIWGLNNEFVSCSQLDDLQCAYATLIGFIQGKNDKSIQVYTCLDNEEVGSQTKQGAGSTFLVDVLKRLNASLQKSEEAYHRAVASGFMVSADNAHAVHPNYLEKFDETNCVYMNEGIVIKSHAGQKYTTEALSNAIFKGLCERVNVPVQSFANRSDVVGGSTLGNISSNQLSIRCVDIGLAQLAMHSSYETVGLYDTVSLIQVMTVFFQTHFQQLTNSNISIEVEEER